MPKQCTAFSSIKPQNHPLDSTKTQNNCVDDNKHVQIGKEDYFLGADGLLMPVRKGQARRTYGTSNSLRLEADCEHVTGCEAHRSTNRPHADRRTIWLPPRGSPCRRGPSRHPYRR